MKQEFPKENERKRPAAYNNNTIMAVLPKMTNNTDDGRVISSWFDRVCHQWSTSIIYCIHVQQQQKCGGSLYIVT
jgi:RecA-family ATPase